MKKMNPDKFPAPKERIGKFDDAGKKRADAAFFPTRARNVKYENTAKPVFFGHEPGSRPAGDFDLTIPRCLTFHVFFLNIYTLSDRWLFSFTHRGAHAF
jgi:hypothetical protein